MIYYIIVGIIFAIKQLSFQTKASSKRDSYTMRLCTIRTWILSMTVTFVMSLQRSLFMHNSNGKYCVDTVFSQSKSRSALYCSVMCVSSSLCLAYSQRGSLCLLHDDVCNSHLLAELGAVYGGELILPIFLLEWNTNLIQVSGIPFAPSKKILHR